MMKENDTKTLPAVPANGECFDCHGTEFTLAKDSTTYSPGIIFVGGKPCTHGSYDDTQPSDAEDSVRFFCAQCGKGYAVPGELQE